MLREWSETLVEEPDLSMALVSAVLISSAEISTVTENSGESSMLGTFHEYVSVLSLYSDDASKMSRKLMDTARSIATTATTATTVPTEGPFLFGL